MSAFNWLHLTDLHWGQTGQKHLWPEIREQFFDDLGYLRGKSGPWQAVLFSGDFVQRGKAEEFGQLDQEVLSSLWETLKKLDSGNAVLLAVPGNHDLQRPDKDKAGKLKSAVRWLLKPEQFSEIADEVFEQSDSHERRVMDNAFASYKAWWKKQPYRANQQIQESDFPGDFSTTFEVDGGYRVGVVGLNCTFLQLADGDYQGRLALDLRQFHAACKTDGGPQDGPAWAKQHDVCLLMTHQGLDWLDDASRNDVYSQINPAGRFAVHLFGHMHEEIIRGETSRGGPMRRFWQGNSLFSQEPIENRPEVKRRHGYAAGSLEFYDDHAMLRHWPRKAVTDPVNSWRFIADGEGCILQDDGGTRAERIDLGRGKTSSSDKGQTAVTESIEQTTQRVLGGYHRAVQQAWDERWSEVITDSEAGNQRNRADDIVLHEESDAAKSYSTLGTSHVERESRSEARPHRRFDVFLCHNSSDKPSVRTLGQDLLNRGLSVWLDEWELVPGRPWQEALEEILETTGAAAVLVGEDGIGPWQNQEMRGCLSEFVDRELPVIPVLLPGTGEKPKLPLFLKQVTWVDLRDGITREGLDRLEWGITGKKPQE